MCAGTTSWNDSSEVCDALFEGLERVQELVKDGLVEVTTNSLTVTRSGKRFLRNICMALDVRLYANQPTMQLFSMAG
jgi:oxygen-independent coproporphyrinogen-3 oxidase